MPLLMIRVWKADWLFSEMCNPLGRKATPAGLLYTPSMAITPSRAGLRRKATFWLVLVNSPPAWQGHAVAVMTRATKAVISFLILNSINEIGREVTFIVRLFGYFPKCLIYINMSQREVVETWRAAPLVKFIVSRLQAMGTITPQREHTLLYIT